MFAQYSRLCSRYIARFSTKQMSDTSGSKFWISEWLFETWKSKGNPYSITERWVPELIPVLGRQPTGDVSHKPGNRLPLLFAEPAVTLATLKRAATNEQCLVNREMTGVNSLPKTVTRERRDCDLNPGPTAPESSTLTTRLPSHPCNVDINKRSRSFDDRPHRPRTCHPHGGWVHSEAALSPWRAAPAHKSTTPSCCLHCRMHFSWRNCPKNFQSPWGNPQKRGNSGAPSCLL